MNQINDAAQTLKPKILDAVRDQFGDGYVRYGISSRRSRWFSLREVHLNEWVVFARLSRVGIEILTSTSKTAFKREIEQHTAYRATVVAPRPGWLRNRPIYICGDGTMIGPRKMKVPKITVAFEPNRKATSRGSRKEWLRQVERLATDQPLPVFALSYAFIGPLLRFAPAHIGNPQCELLGKTETGKSTLNLWAASVWRGDPDSETGGAESWDMTIGFLDRSKVKYADGLQAVEETNLAGDTKKQRGETIEKAVFKNSTSGGRKRLTDPEAMPDDVRVATMSTSNIAMSDAIRATEHVQAALASRMATIPVPDEGVLANVPKGFRSTAEAIEQLRALVNEHYGTAGRRFVQHLADFAARDEKGLRAEILRLYEKHRMRSDRVSSGTPARRAKLFAMTFVAGTLARKWGCLPKKWRRLGPSIRAIEQSVGTAPGRAHSAVERVREYSEENKNSLVEVSDIDAPIDVRLFNGMPGFLRRVAGRLQILIPSARFQAKFPDYQSLMAELRAANRAKTEEGKKPKLTIKTPKGICASGRVYCIDIGF